ncbi:hypothetical protein C2869_14950 [Saccharobesus litoralis]|uniref:SEC-C motif-containing protein n=1 Tax=Saccharobesus litoralis TaxID=2172099 RepID=A0A2S0VTV6_9ALTE|nr:SEC-C domain-containing protein [Saccharobesus litoralis]AWB67654.1 hypothetical protein C2869_14950 [Saccharobesus litoralis]
MGKFKRNQICFCGSGKKYKNCCRWKEHLPELDTVYFKSTWKNKLIDSSWLILGQVIFFTILFLYVYVEDGYGPIKNWALYLMYIAAFMLVVCLIKSLLFYTDFNFSQKGITSKNLENNFVNWRDVVSISTIDWGNLITEYLVIEYKALDSTHKKKKLRLCYCDYTLNEAFELANYYKQNSY